MHIADQQALLSALTPFGGVLKRGGHSCKDGVCARELTSVLREIPWTDDPDRSPFDRWAWALNDAAWSSDQVRTDQMLWAAGIDGKLVDRSVWIRVAERGIREILPLILDKIGLYKEAENCRQEGTEKSAREAQKAAYAYAANANAAYAYAANANAAYAYAANAAYAYAAYAYAANANAANANAANANAAYAADAYAAYAYAADAYAANAAYAYAANANANAAYAADAAYADAYAAAYARDEILALAVRIVREEVLGAEVDQ